ncbi:MULTISPECIES: hypothetical protein [unclassified Bradyrhizobium]|uniref:hypothetical protein n=1 Tax=unclassified Bradyrhizobium TaxID=2631580 RepID=UPI002478D014|nr:MULTISPECIES: hypothetical protein [unclassified Bradyrhizobium]WGR71665.1 hypothetical protein MTX24_01460 [Bradyrhizobium sp. ISRA426]WGR76500.1 hypothetical protein MTX21_26410 [Bradyrhizobium sp. ISRA430]WGR86905.1 hypothetical protein MTX25_01460 [Bradyrhizobium sp. ISRA432]
METTVYRQSNESSEFDSDQSYPTAPYIRARAARADLSPDDPVPLFLSDPLSAPDPGEFAPLALQPKGRIVPHILAAVLVASAMIVLGAVFQSDLRGLLAAYAGGSVAAAPDQTPANLPAAKQTAVKDPARVSDIKLASADAQDLPAPSTPSREAIATAYQNALQSQAPAPVAAQPAPPPQPAKTLPAKTLPAKTLDADTLAGLMTRAKSLLTVGDIVSARLLLERAANAQDATAAFLLAQTYDPAVLGTNDTRTIAGDATAARDWYEKAAGLGSAEARQRLTQLQN